MCDEKGHGDQARVNDCARDKNRDRDRDRDRGQRDYCIRTKFLSGGAFIFAGLAMIGRTTFPQRERSERGEKEGKGGGVGRREEREREAACSLRSPRVIATAAVCVFS